MGGRNWERWGAASGLAALVAGAIGGALERGWPNANEPAAVAAFIAANRAAILGQSVFFLVSFAFYLWFLGSLCSFLLRAEGETGRLSAVAFGAGLAWLVIGMVAQAFQMGVTMAGGDRVDPALLWTMSATFSIANIPCAVMLFAVAVVSLRHAAFPAWLGWLSAAVAIAQLLLFCGALVPSGPLAPNGWLTYALYPLFLVWLVPTIVVMFRRLGKASTAVAG